MSDDTKLMTEVIRNVVFDGSKKTKKSTYLLRKL